MITWIKPNGNEVETNDLKASVEAAKAHGWKEKKKEVKKEDKKAK